MDLVRSIYPHQVNLQRSLSAARTCKLRSGFYQGVTVTPLGEVF